jgi:nitrite reductase (NADH) small subunit
VETPQSKARRPWYRAAGLSELQEGSARIVTVEGRSVGLVKLADGVFAMRNQCPHQGAALFMGVVKGTMLPSEPGEYVYGLKDRVIRCPLHGWEFDIETGKAMFGISNKRVVTYPTEIRDGDVFVQMPQRDS